MTAHLSLQHKRYYKNKHVLVTGGAGFIGSTVVDRLVQCGAHVTVLDNLSTGTIDNLSQSAKDITFVHGSICNTRQVEKALAHASHLFHFAALTSVPESCKDPERYHQINTGGTELLYNAAQNVGIQSLVFASSSAIYGAQEGTCSETDTPQPASPYAQTKLDGEALGKQLAQAAGIHVANLRFFNVHGPRQNPHGDYAGVVAKFRSLLASKQPITLFGDGMQTRDFIHVDDVATACLQAGITSGMRGQAINVASGTSISVKQLLANLEEEMNTTAVRVITQPARDGDVLHSHANTSRLQRLLAYKHQ